MNPAHSIFSLRRPILTIAATFLLLSISPTAFARTFTATDGRTIEATVMKVNGDSAVLKRSDGRAVTVPLNILSKADLEYLTDWAKEEAKNRVPRVKVTVESNKRDKAIRAGFDDRRGSFQFEILISNEERGFRIENATATLIVLGDYLSSPDEKRVMQRADFKDISMEFGKTFRVNGDEVRYEYDREYDYGLKYSDYVFVLKNATGKVIDISGSNGRIENLADIILKLKEGDTCNGKYQKIKPTRTSFGSIRTLR